MKLKDVIELNEQGTQASDVSGIQKAMYPIVRRKVPAGYVADVRKKKKKKITEGDDANLAYTQSTSKGMPSPPDNLFKTFRGDRPKYKQKKKFLNKKKVEEQAITAFGNGSPYHDLEYLTKFWRGTKDGESTAGESKGKRKEKTKKKKPQGTYQPDVQKNKLENEF
jgi:hypothetical protein